jgi:hypothetical protein
MSDRHGLRDDHEPQSVRAMPRDGGFDVNATGRAE